MPSLGLGPSSSQVCPDRHSPSTLTQYVCVWLHIYYTSQYILPWINEKMKRKYQTDGNTQQRSLAKWYDHTKVTKLFARVMSVWVSQELNYPELPKRLECPQYYWSLNRSSGSSAPRGLAAWSNTDVVLTLYRVTRFRAKKYTRICSVYILGDVRVIRFNAWNGWQSEKYQKIT